MHVYDYQVITFHCNKVFFYVLSTSIRAHFKNYDHTRHALSNETCFRYQYCQCAGYFVLAGISVSNIGAGCAEPDCTEEVAVDAE